MLGHRSLVVEDYIAMVKRRGWIVLIPMILFPIIGYGITFFIAPQYLSQTLVLIEGQKVPDNYVRPVISSDIDSRMASMKEQILSRSRIQPIVERYNLYSDKHMSLDDRIDLVRKSIEIRPITSEIARSGGLPGFYISFKAGDAHTAQLICGEITSLFLGENLRSREASAEGTTDFIKSQLADAKRNLDEQDAKLAAFQRQYMGRLPDEESPNVNMLTSLNTQLEATTQNLNRMEQDKSYAEALLAQQVQAYQAYQSAAASNGSVASAQGPGMTGPQMQLQALLTQEADLTSHYTDDYPDVIAVRRKIADLRKQIARTPSPAASTSGSTSSTVANRFDPPAIQQLRNQIRSLDLNIQEKRKEQAQLQTNIRTYQDRIESSPIVEQQYKELTRDYQTTLAAYNDLLGKMNQSKMATDLEKRQQGEQFKIMDEANLPDAPFSPKRSVFVVAGLAGGLGLGLMIVAFLEYKDTSMRTERDVWAFTKLPTLAVIAYSETISVDKKPGFFSRFAHLFSRKKTKPALAQANT
jgi:polysaccharide chain length determinant protein (PEP-CTERM system associated)